MGYGSHMARFRPGSEIIIQTQKLDDVVDLIHYCEVLLDQQDPWMLEKCPIVRRSQQTLELANGSTIHGAPSGADQIRHSHPTLYIIDEMAFLSEAGQCWDNAHPVAEQIIGVSSAAPGYFGNMCDRNLAI